jgi:hypothetical protein
LSQNIFGVYTNILNTIPPYCIELGLRIREYSKSTNKSIEEIAYKAGIDAQNL